MTNELAKESTDTQGTQALATILLVDDEPNVLAGLTLHLRRRFNVLTAANGGSALALLHNSKKLPAVIISDMNMPGMDGATLLASVRKVHPEIVRVLLTGQANVNSAIASINDGQVFRFLTKPCAPAQLLAAIDAAVTQYELVVSERVLLHETLHGSIEALVEVLSLTSPVIFGRAIGFKTLAGGLANAVNSTNVWQVEMAAMFSQLGQVTLPPEVSEKMYHGGALSVEEAEMVARVPAVTDHLLAHIPRLQGVRDILARVARLADSPVPIRDDTPEAVRDSALLLDLARRYLLAEARGESPASIISRLRARHGWYTPASLDALQTLRCNDDTVEALHETTVAHLHPGMVLGEDLHMASGQLLAPRGYTVTASFIERCKNARAGTIAEPVRVLAFKEEGV